MWALVENNSVTKIIQAPESVSIGAGKDAVKYPRDIFTKWTAAQLLAVGIYPVQLTNTVDGKVYQPQRLDQATFVVNVDHVAATFNRVARDTLGRLKTSLNRTVNQQARQRYAEAVDPFYAEKYRVEVEGGTHVIPAAIKTYAGQLKAAVAAYKGSVAAAANVPALADLTVNWPTPPTI